MSDSDSGPEQIPMVKKGNKTKSPQQRISSEQIKQGPSPKRKLKHQMKIEKQMKRRRHACEDGSDSNSDSEDSSENETIEESHHSKRQFSIPKRTEVVDSDAEISSEPDSAPEEISNTSTQILNASKHKMMTSNVSDEEDEEGEEEDEEESDEEEDEESEEELEGEEDEESEEVEGEEDEDSEEVEDERRGANGGEETYEEDLSGGESKQSRTQAESSQSVDKSYVALRKELLNMPFDELQQLKEKIGIKLYNQVLFGQEVHSKKRKFKRENKNRPMEISSKVKTRRQRQVIPVKKQLVRDPRFDDLSGEYKEDIFKSTYSFLSDVKQNEKQKLQKQLQKEKDGEKKNQLEYLVRRMTAQEKAEKNKEQQLQRERTRKKNERILVTEGKKPFYLKKSDRKTLELAEKYRELKKSGKVDKYLSKKRKKNSQKERRNLPIQQ